MVTLGEAVLTELQRKKVATLTIRNLQVIMICSGQAGATMIVITTVVVTDLLELEMVTNGDELAGRAIQTIAIRWQGPIAIDATAGHDMTQGTTP